MKLPEFVINALSRRFGVPDLAVRMFRVASQLSGLDKSTLPVELLPLNSVQLSRGLLNFTILQSLDRWVFPFWAEQQYDPRSPSFIPRSHLGLSMNVTHRNWTSIGNAVCSVEPTVDPRGLITPFPDGWSIDTWLRVEREVHFLSRAEGVSQTLHEALPIVETRFELRGIVLELSASTCCSCLHQVLTVVNTREQPFAGSIGVAVRPFNPEGVALVSDLAIEHGGLELVVNKAQTLHLGTLPSRVLLSNKKRGDSAWIFAGQSRHEQRSEVSCPAGLANGVAEYFLALGPGETWRGELWLVLEGSATEPRPTLDDAVRAWHGILGNGATCTLPDKHLADLNAASHAYLLGSLDDTMVKPGPSTYHYFWFRDAAYMLLALDRLGHGNITRKVLAGYPKLQEPSGMFRSQQGEWDSTGQAIWSVWQHAMLSHDRSILEELFPSLAKAVQWIANMRMKNGGNPLTMGLMPKGLSAEHLGLADVYYWDTFWSLAGLEAFCRICQILQNPHAEARARTLATALRTDLERSIATAMVNQGIAVIPPGPTRAADAGMIGSIAAWYPLQLFPPEDGRMRSTLASLQSTWFLQGMFYQPIVHSGLNAYLSLHVAQGLLYAGDTERFWQILSDVAQKTTPTYTFPEAIHPITGGGAMGDGHHLWAAAEVSLAVRNAFAMERWTMLQRGHELIFLGGIPQAMFLNDAPFSILRAPVPEGSVDVAVSREDRNVIIQIELQEQGIVPRGSWSLSLPNCFDTVWAEGNMPVQLDLSAPRHLLPIPAETQRIRCALSKQRL